MNSPIFSMSDNDFVHQFESLTLSPEYFDHRGHLRLAWLYLDQYSLDEALSKISLGIKRYADSLGASDKFHATITDAITRIVAVRMARQQREGWQGFIEDNKDLVKSALEVLHRFYSPELLDSKAAKMQVMAPDRAVISIAEAAH